MRAQAAVVISGAARGRVHFDAPFDFSLDQENYPAWQSFMAYMAYTFRGTDHTPGVGLYDDLLYRWTRFQGADYRSLGECLGDEQCAECAGKPYLQGLSPYDRACTFIHNWRVANYVNSYAFADSEYGFDPAFGFSPAGDIGYWQDLDGITSDNADAVPPETTLTKANLTQNVVISGTRRTSTSNGWVYAPMSLGLRGAEYWVVRSDTTLRNTSQDLVVRVTPEGVTAGCLSSGLRIFVTVVGYSTEDTAGNVPAQLWRHGEWANQAVGPAKVLVDSLDSPAEVILPNFGSASEAAVVVITLEDGASGANPDPVALGPILPYHITLALRPSGSTAANPVRITATPSETECHPAWSPLGNELVFERYTPGTTNSQLYRRTLDGSSDAALISQPYPQYRPDWSPRGDLIAYDADMGGQNDIWTYNLSSHELLQLTTSLYNEIWPCFSPNGQLLTYVRFIPGQIFGTWELHEMGLDGTRDVVLARLSSQHGAINTPRWSPDGTRIYYVYDDSLYSVGASGAAIQAVDGGDISYGEVDANVDGGPFAVTEDYRPSNCVNTHVYSRVVLRSASPKASDPRFFARDNRFDDVRWSWDGVRVAYCQGVDCPCATHDLWVAPTTYNHSPQFVGLEDQRFPACTPFVLGLQATDADGEPVTFSMVDNPGGTLNGSTYRWQVPQAGTLCSVSSQGPIRRGRQPSGAILGLG